MIGGEEAAVERARPLFETMGKTMVRQGRAALRRRSRGLGSAGRAVTGGPAGEARLLRR